MIEKSTSSRQARAEWPIPHSPQRVRKVQHQQQRHSPLQYAYSHAHRRRTSPSASPPASFSSSSTLSRNRRSSSSRPSYDIRITASNFDFYDYQNQDQHQHQQKQQRTSSLSSVASSNANINANVNANLNLMTAQSSLADATQWMPDFTTGAINSLSIPISPEDARSPEFPQYMSYNGEASLSLQTSALSGLGMPPWDFMDQNTTTNMNGCGFEDMHMSETSYGSHGSMVVSASTMSATSENFPFPLSQGFASAGGVSPLLGLTLPAAEYDNQDLIPDNSSMQRTESINTSLPVTSSFPFDSSFQALDWSFDDMNNFFPMTTEQSAPAPLLAMPNFYSNAHDIRSQNPWNPLDAENSFGQGGTTGQVPFEPPQIPYETINDDVATQSSIEIYAPEPPMQNWLDESDSSSYANTTYTPSHGSPISHHSPHSQSHPSPHSQPHQSPHSQSHPSPHSQPHQSPHPQSHPSPHSQSHPSPHSHPSPASPGSHSHVVFSAYAEPHQGKVTRGRVRPLTDKEKREARDVRQAGACWACHLSKIKCSPCSSGSPCEQCNRLSGKRRFCLLPCFNDPVEMLDMFLVPDYMTRQYTVENTEKFIKKNASGFGSDEMIIRLSWGYRVPLKVTVVSLSVRGSTSVFRYQSQTYINKDGPPTFTKKKSPPLGIPPTSSMYGKHEEYKRYIERIVKQDLPHYVSIAYVPEESDLAKRLLRTISQFYSAGVAAGDEYQLLREAIEIHIACTFLDRSLVMDDESTKMVEDRLGEEYPPDSAPRCAQRQIKVAFFQIQQDRIKDVLKDWGQLMWTSNRSMANERKWAIGFSVLLVLTLVMDKTLGLSWCTSQSRVQHGGKDAEVEKNEFQERVKVTQTNLFERCKEILHSKFKTRKGGKESFNPIRDGEGAWRGKVIDETIAGFVRDIRKVVQEFEPQVRSCRARASKNPRDDSLLISLKVDDSPYTDAARLACVFLDDFLEH